MNLLFYLVLSPKLFGRPTAIALGGPLATTLSWLENTLFGKNKLFSGIPPIFWTLLSGIILGSFIAGLISKELRWTSFKKIKLGKIQLFQAMIGGILVAFGVLLANGCLIKHLLSGLPGLSSESLIVVLGIVAGIWTTLKIQGKNLKIK
ncbi:MAG TPA: hypothetical protein DHV62_08625 [Elusimicrobia bacterium]|nr:hypothetical protein [Elusimicrobiota bacterium]